MLKTKKKNHVLGKHVSRNTYSKKIKSKINRTKKTTKNTIKKTKKTINKDTKVLSFKKLKGGCDIPNWPDWDDVNERWNGIRSGKIYNLLQFYKFIDWKDCIAMKKLSIKLTGQKLSSKKEEQLKKQSTEAQDETMTDLTREARFIAGLSKLNGYVLYDITGQIKEKIKENINTTSFLIGSSKITPQGLVSLTQATEDNNQESKDNGLLSLEFKSSDYIYIIINKFEKSKTLISYIEECLGRKLNSEEQTKFAQNQSVINGDFFFFRKSDTDWSWSTRKARLKKLIDAMKMNRATYLLQREALTVQQRIAALVDK